MIEYTDKGNLTPGFHSYTMKEFEEQFINPFPLSKERVDIFESFKQWLVRYLYPCPLPEYVWIAGGYVTNKLAPGDIDIILRYAPESIQNEEQKQAIGNAIHISGQFQVHSFICYTTEHWSEHKKQKHQTDVNSWDYKEKYWMGQFSFDRQKNPKGIVTIGKNELHSFIRRCL